MNVFSEIESITEQATTVINYLVIFCIENVLRMIFSVFLFFFVIILIYIISIFCYK